MEYETLIYEAEEGIATITLNRPQKLNSINDAMLHDLDAVFMEIEPDLDIKVVVIKGAGRAFCAGQDLGGTGTFEVMPPDPRSNLSARDLMEAQKRWSRRWEYIFNFGKPTIAQVHGYCLGAGLHLTMVCDLVIASDDALFGDPSSRMGALSPIPLWIWFVGVKRTKDLLYSGRQIGGPEAEKMGLINLSVPPESLDEQVKRYARAISIPPGDGMTLTKESLNANLEVRGAGVAWRFLDEMQVITSLQQSKGLDEEFNFYEVRDRQGLKAALEERDRFLQGLGF